MRVLKGLLEVGLDLGLGILMLTGFCHLGLLYLRYSRWTKRVKDL